MVISCWGDTSNKNQPDYKLEYSPDSFDLMSSHPSTTSDDSSSDDSGSNESPISDQKVMVYFDQIKAAVQKNDYVWLSNQFTYPLCVDINCRPVQVNKPEELLKYMDKIFAADIKNIVSNQDRNNLFERNDSYMIGQGEIWFDLPHGILNVANNTPGTYSIVDCGNSNTQALPRKYYGTWEIYRTTDASDQPSDYLLTKSQRKLVQITPNSFINDSSFFETTLKDVEWIIVETDYLEVEPDYEEGTLLWYGDPEAIPNKSLMVMACSGGQEHLYLEVAKNGELCTYYDDSFIFMRKIK